MLALLGCALCSEGAAPPHTLQTLMRLRGGAEVGKGDPRWIVQDRPDGANVNSGHWEERDMLMWSREQLKALLVGARGELEDFEGYKGHYEVTNVTSITGDCVIHLRKGRLWPLCDLGLGMSIKGTCEKDGADTPITGTIIFPEVTMDDRDNLQVQATTSSKGAGSEVFGRWLRKEGYKAAEDAVQKFLDALNAKASANQPPEDDAEKMRKALAAADKMAQVNKVMASIPTPTADDDKGAPTGKLELEEEFFAGKLDIYDCLTLPAVSLSVYR
jgi:activator of HSP90 ATPase